MVTQTPQNILKHLIKCNKSLLNAFRQTQSSRLFLITHHLLEKRPMRGLPTVDQWQRNNVAATNLLNLDGCSRILGFEGVL